MSSNAKDFFGSGGVEHPTGIGPLDGNLEKSGTDAGFLLERKLSLQSWREPHADFYTVTFPRALTWMG